MAARELQQFRELSFWADSGSTPWITASWNPNTERVEYGCRVCVSVLEKGMLKMPHRYRNRNNGCHCFAYSNVYRDVRKAIPNHDKCKTHHKAVAIVEQMAFNPTSTSLTLHTSLTLQNHMYLAFRKLSKYRPAQDFIESCIDCAHTGGNVQRDLRLTASLAQPAFSSRTCAMFEISDWLISIAHARCREGLVAGAGGFSRVTLSLRRRLKRVLEHTRFL